MKRVKIHCPVCNKSGKIEVDETLLEKSKRGILAVNIDKSIICPHSFISYIDKNFNIRDSFVSDFTLELANINIQDENRLNSHRDLEKIDLNLVISNITLIELASILKGVFSKKNVLLLNDSEIISQELPKILEFIFEISFDYNIAILNRIEYIRYKHNYENYEVIDYDEIFDEEKKKKILKNTKIESAFIKKFLSEKFPISGLIILRNEVLKAFELSKTIIKILQNHSNTGEFTRKELIYLLSEKYEIEIQSNYFEFLLDIIKNYHEYDLSIISNDLFPSLRLYK